MLKKVKLMIKKRFFFSAQEEILFFIQNLLPIPNLILYVSKEVQFLIKNQLIISNK